ncbi:ethanolamine ammonia-lyase subunit EutC (plasmid) [Deinococcus sp. KNUC1210]|uniref:ethanolamine ammonia-lyase subunit EutC n=1 Tax=Deinococcus sp. KNUC1210 TaxID=2917691 RepID=UPI001EF09293|nr:ethanolamine ammonia-lyase subunit EutC [Deinococcus sp. KNUC1210]ULH14083.1 ethanolamine ammonia-lyase subunit EutC [Deinococcus sp. KNUC1210]
MTDDADTPATLTPWERLRHYTDARIALGRVGTSLPTRELLNFNAAHAAARDAVHAPGSFAELKTQLLALNLPFLELRSCAAHRSEYLRRPDLGRRLSAESRAQLEALPLGPPPDILIMVSDGLSAVAADTNAGAVLTQLVPALLERGYTLAPVLLAAQARVALADEAAELLGARLALHLIGERPGLSSPNSLGAYLTYGPRVGMLDSGRNCVSNIRPAGLSAPAAVHRLLYLVGEALRRQLSGVELKDESGDGRPALPPG